MRDDAASGLPFADLIEAGEHLLWSGQPTAAGLFLADLPGLIFNLFAAALAAIGFVYAISQRQGSAFAASGLFLAVFAVVFVRRIGRAIAGRHLYYLITDRRILSVDERRLDEAFVIARSRPPGGAGRWLGGEPRRGRLRGGRATIHIRYCFYGLRRLSPGDDHDWLRLVRVAEPDRALAALRQSAVP